MLDNATVVARGVRSIRDIGIAFASAHVPDGVRKELSTASEVPEYEATCLLFNVGHWADLSHGVLRASHPSPFMIGPIAFTYFLPAFMICIVESIILETCGESGASRASPFLDLFAMRVFPPRGKGTLPWNRVVEVDFFSNDQRSATAGTFRLISEYAYAGDPKLIERVHRVIHEYLE